MRAWEAPGRGLAGPSDAGLAGRGGAAGGPVCPTVLAAAGVLIEFQFSMAPSCQLYACPLRFALPACSVIAQEVLRSHTLPGVVQTLAHVGVLARLWPGTLLAFFIVVSGQTPCWAAAESSLPPGDTSAPCTPSRWPCLSRPSRSPPVLCSWGWLAASLWLNYPEALHPTWTPPPPPFPPRPFHPGPSTPALLLLRSRFSAAPPSCWRARPSASPPTSPPTSSYCGASTATCRYVSPGSPRALATLVLPQ